MRASLWSAAVVTAAVLLGAGCKRGEPKADPKPATSESSSTKTEKSAKSAKQEDEPAKEEARHEFTVSYAKTRHAEMTKLAAFLKQSELFDKIAEALTEEIILKKDIEIVLKDCGEVNAYFSPKDSSINMCYELLGDFAARFQSQAKNEEDLLKKMLEADLFVFFHELGHALVKTLELPITGKEEDAVDQLSTVVLLDADRCEEDGHGGLDMVLSGASWFLTKSKAGQKLSAAHFADEHSLDDQRFFNIACLVYGHDPGSPVGTHIVANHFLPEARAVRCKDEWKQVSGAWKTILKPHLRHGFDTPCEKKDTKKDTKKKKPKKSED